MAEMLDHMKTLSMPNFKRNFSEIRFSNFNGLKSSGWPKGGGKFENEFMSKGETFFHSSSSIVVIIMKEIHLRTKWANQRNIQYPSISRATYKSPIQPTEKFGEN